MASLLAERSLQTAYTSRDYYRPNYRHLTPSPASTLNENRHLANAPGCILAFSRNSSPAALASPVFLSLSLSLLSLCGSLSPGYPNPQRAPATPDRDFGTRLPFASKFPGESRLHTLENRATPSWNNVDGC